MRQNLKIAVVMPLAEQRGGAEMALDRLVREGRDLGVEWLVIFLESGPMVQQFQQYGVEIRVVEARRLSDLPRYLKAVRRIASIVKETRCHLIYGWMSKAQLYGGPAALLAGVPAFWQQHGLPSPTNWMDRVATLLPARGILTCSETVSRAQARLKPVRPMRAVYSGVDLERFDPDALPTPAEVRERFGLPRNGPLIGIVGRLQRWKGMHVLLGAMPEIRRHHPDAHCVLVGGEHALEPDYPAFLEGRIVALNLGDHVTLTGMQNNVPEWMQAMDVIVHASDCEPLGLVILEAMALGKPVVAGSSGGPTEIVSEEKNGLLAPYGDERALASAVLRYLDDPAFARRVGCVARQQALSFSTHRYAENNVSAIRSILNSPKS